MATLKSFEELKCWQSCRRFRLLVRDLLKRFPKDEMFLLTAQLKDSSRSTTHNIAEGFGRDNALDNARFCRVARGSLMEALDQLITSQDEGLITEEELEKGRELFTEARALLDGYIDYLSKAKGDSMLREPMMPYGTDRAVVVGTYGYPQHPTHPTFNPQPVQP